MFSDGVQKELKQYGIRVFKFYPGGMETEFAKKAGLQPAPHAMELANVASEILHALCLARNMVVDERIFRVG